jgi:hypothetical protein
LRILMLLTILMGMGRPYCLFIDISLTILFHVSMIYYMFLLVFVLRVWFLKYFNKLKWCVFQTRVSFWLLFFVSPSTNHREHIILLISVHLSIHPLYFGPLSIWFQFRNFNFPLSKSLEFNTKVQRT